jgi:PKD repeat protein
MRNGGIYVMMRWACCLFFLAITVKGIAQCNTLDFSSPAQACLTQNITFIPNNTSASYDWDFCSGDLELLPTESTLLAATYSNTIAVVLDNGSYYGFYLSGATNNLFRLEFGATLTTVPTAVDLGGLGISLSDWRTIKVAKEGSTYYGFFVGNNSLYRINFGTNIKNTPSNAEVIFSGTPIAVPIDLSIVTEGGANFIFVVNLGNNSIIRFQSSSLASAPSSFSMDLVPGPSVPALGGIAMMKECSQWYGFVTSISTDRIYKILFGAGLSDTAPTVTDIGVSTHAPAGIALVPDNGNFYAFIQCNSQEIFRIQFGTTLSNASPVLTDFGNIIPGEGLGFSMYKSNSDWVGFSTGKDGIYKLSFPNNCFSATSTSTLMQPSLTVASAGNYSITLTEKDASNQTSYKSKSLTVLSSTSPDISFITQNECAIHDVNFISNNSSGNITTYQWDFGDMATASGATVTHQYATAGVYSIALTVTASNACQNNAQKTLTIYNAPIANFALPIPTVVCTGQSYTFTNTTTADAGSNPSWQWNVNGVSTSTAQDLSQVFSTTATNQIQLMASIPGCTTSSSQNFTVQQPGPTVDFTFPNGCNGQALAFTNTSVGSINGYLWTFGDGQFSSSVSPTNTYANIGSYTVTLEATSSNGCNNSTAKDVTIYTTPAVAFALDLPPFSCSGTPSQFNDSTANPTDSNLSSWAWTFGDVANGSSNQRNPLYTYSSAGPYIVGLTVGTNFGCYATLSKSISISQSPAASFQNAPACVNQGTQFTDTSTGNIKSWLWKIGSATYSYANPIQVFVGQGLYTVQLAVTDSNNCVSQTSRSINVPVNQAADFSVSAACATKPANFQNVMALSADPIVSTNWIFGSLGTGSGTQAQYVFPSVGDYSVTMNAEAQSGCIYSVTKSVTMIVPPQAGFTPAPPAGAVPLVVTFTNTSSNATSYFWEFNDPDHSTSTDLSPEFTFQQLGDYIVDLTASNSQGCLDVHSEVISAVNTKVDISIEDVQLVQNSAGAWQVSFSLTNLGNLPLANPTIDVNLSGNSTLQQNLSLSLPPGQTVSQVLNYSLLPAGLQYVCVAVEASNDSDPYNNKGCASLGSEEIQFGPYPNPTESELRLDWIAQTAATVHVVIYTLSGGKALDQEIASDGAGLNQIRIDVSNLNPGMYLVVVEHPGLNKAFRFVIN